MNAVKRPNRLGRLPAQRAAGTHLIDRHMNMKSAMRTRGEIEAAIGAGVTQFQQEYLGRGPKDIRTYLLGDIVLVRLQGILTAAEQHLVKSMPAEKGRDLLKQVRTHLIEVARPTLMSMIETTTGTVPVSLHHDISTVTGEEVIVITLSAAPEIREAKRK
jgi:uncharacterized protein YbcI